MEYANKRIVDERGRPIVLSSHQKNQLYRQAKDMKEQLRDRMCTTSECKRPTDENVQKMINSEFSKDCKSDREKYAKAMQAIGADPKDCSVENLRRKR